MKLLKNILLIIFLISLETSCTKKNIIDKRFFDVGFESLKTNQGVCRDNITGEEEIFFVKTEFNPHIKFYNLTGKLTDSISLGKVAKDIGRLNRISLISKDTIIAISYSELTMAGLKSNGEYHFICDLKALNNYQDNIYDFYGSIFPTPITWRDNVILIPIWNKNKADEKKGLNFTSEFEYYKYIVSHQIKSPQICKIESIFSKTPDITFGLEEFYYNISPSLKPYYPTGSLYTILNNKLFYLNSFERNLYELDLITLAIKNIIPVVPDEYKIPVSTEITEELMTQSIPEIKELKDKCYITNMLYNAEDQKYYIFLKIGTDNSAIDELGYPFKLIIYDDSFNQESEKVYNTDEYNPKSALMTSEGILIEKIEKNNSYGKKTFVLLKM